MPHTVGEVAKLAGISVRTLHHYDEIGLLTPSGRSDAGYRLYQRPDLERLQEILFYRELGLGLDDIRNVTSEPGYDRIGALRSHRTKLEDRVSHLRAMIDAVDAALEAAEKGTTMNEEDMFEAFGDFDPKQYEEEARERWGATDAHRVSTRRTSQYTREQWKEIRDEAEAIAHDFAAVFEGGMASDGEEATAAAERHRLHIDRWFYPCSHQMHVGLGDMYLADARFTEYWDAFAPGLAGYVQEAIMANALRAT